MGTWIFGIIMALISVIGLFVASRAHEQVMSTAGFALVAFGGGREHS